MLLLLLLTSIDVVGDAVVDVVVDVVDVADVVDVVVCSSWS